MQPLPCILLDRCGILIPQIICESHTCFSLTACQLSSFIIASRCIYTYISLKDMLRRWATWFFAHVKYLQKNKCESSSLKKVNNCPKSNVALQDRSQNLKCDVYPECQGEPLVYHCVKFDGYLVEVCSPKSPIVGM